MIDFYIFDIIKIDIIVVNNEMFKFSCIFFKVKDNFLLKEYCNIF